MKRRHGNSFEMATLLCSLLIGNNYGAFVVSGYATREVVNNDQKRVDCPYIPQCWTQVHFITHNWHIFNIHTTNVSFSHTQTHPRNN